MGSADIIVDAKSSRNRGRRKLRNENRPGLFPSTEEFGFWPQVQESSLSWAQGSAHGLSNFDLQSKTVILLAQHGSQFLKLQVQEQAEVSRLRGSVGGM